MPTSILMPALSPTMEEGTLARWHVKAGDRISPGDVIAEIETDKATMEYEAADEGTIRRIVVPEGTSGVRVNAVIAELDDGENAIDPSVPPSVPTEEKNAKATSPSAGAPSRPSGPRILASPLARRLAADQGIDLHAVTGSGPGGRIVKADVTAAADRRPAPPSTEPAPKAVSAAAPDPAERIKAQFADRPLEEVPLDAMRRTIAARLTESKRTVPHFYLRRDVHLDELLAFRKRLNDELQSRNVNLSINDFIIKAAANALQEVPDCNAIWAGDRMLRLRASDVAVAVAVEGGLLTPVLRDAERKSLSALSREMKDLAARARARSLTPAEYTGGSFTISNLGMMGIESFDAIINPPQSAILAVGAALQRPVVTAGGEIEAATVMSVTLSVDHRVIDGALGAQLLSVLVRNLESPLVLLA